MRKTKGGTHHHHGIKSKSNSNIIHEEKWNNLLLQKDILERVPPCLYSGKEQEPWKRRGGPSRCCRCVGQEQPEAQPHVGPEPEAPPHVGPEPEEEELGEADFAEEEADREGNQHKKLEGPHWAHCSFKEHEPAEFHRGPKHKSLLVVCRPYDQICL
ncbi:hypothetical protein P8452_45489 [Trifolium repens]|nr:hypothetical protein P8452_45489 [Trifolium repens]